MRRSTTCNSSQQAAESIVVPLPVVLASRRERERDLVSGVGITIEPRLAGSLAHTKIAEAIEAGRLRANPVTLDCPGTSEHLAPDAVVVSVVRLEKSEAPIVLNRNTERVAVEACQRVRFRRSIRVRLRKAMRMPTPRPRAPRSVSRSSAHPRVLAAQRRPRLRQLKASRLLHPTDPTSKPGTRRYQGPPWVDAVEKGRRG